MIFQIQDEKLREYDLFAFPAFVLLLPGSFSTIKSMTAVSEKYVFVSLKPIAMILNPLVLKVEEDIPVKQGHSFGVTQFIPSTIFDTPSNQPHFLFLLHPTLPSSFLQCNPPRLHRSLHTANRPTYRFPPRRRAPDRLPTARRTVSLPSAAARLQERRGASGAAWTTASRRSPAVPPWRPRPRDGPRGAGRSRWRSSKDQVR